jgi:hypothetical protein
LYGCRRIARASTERGRPTHEHESFPVNPVIDRYGEAITKVIKKGFRGTELPRIEGKDRQATGHAALTCGESRLLFTATYTFLGISVGDDRHFLTSIRPTHVTSSHQSGHFCQKAASKGLAKGLCRDLLRQASKTTFGHKCARPEQ